MEELTNFLASWEFIKPLYFWIGGILVLFVIFFPWARKRRGLAIDLHYWKPKAAFTSKRVWMLSIPVIIVSILMAGALSDPQAITKTKTLIYGKPVMLVFDVSGSMQAASELKPEQSGYESALEAFNYLISQREEISFGLEIFSNDNYICRYFTYKNELFKDTLENKDEIIRIARGTNIAGAILRARLFLTNKTEGKDKAIVVVSDLETDPYSWSEMIEEIETALFEGIDVYIITLKGIESSDTIPQVLGVKVANINDQSAISQIYEELSVMESSPIRMEESFSKESMIPLLILPALGIITLCLVLDETRFRKIP